MKSSSTTQEIGGYIEAEHYEGTLYHDHAIKLNCGRSCLAYLIEARDIRSIWMPDYMCKVVKDVCLHYNVVINAYPIGKDFLPKIDIVPEQGEYLYLCDYFGQLNKRNLDNLLDKFHGKVIIDRAQSYFTKDENQTDVLYTCRKYFGVADGAFLYTDSEIGRTLSRGYSYDKYQYILGRMEKGATDFYRQSRDNNNREDFLRIELMSPSTENLLRSLDYPSIETRRRRNFTMLDRAFCATNQLKLSHENATFAYPLLINNGAEIRRELINRKIYVPQLWPNVLKECNKDSDAFFLASNTLVLPIDQRYGEDEMAHMIHVIEEVSTK